MTQISQVQTSNGISWHVEQAGSGPHLVLIPSGEGDGSVFTKLFTLLSSHFTITTFDMPGFSRTTCPLSALENLTPTILAGQIISLMDALSIPSATFYGSSSGGLAVLALLAAYEQRVDRIFIHEVPMKVLPSLHEWIALLDQGEEAHERIIKACQGIFREHMNEDAVAWDALGEAYHQRLAGNFITWLKYYPSMVDRQTWDIDGLRRNRERVKWSVGALMLMGAFFENVVLAGELGIKVQLLNSKHFPQVSIPETLAEYIKNSCSS